MTKVAIKGDSTPEAGSEFTLTCSVEPGNPRETKFSWYRNGERISVPSDSDELTYQATRDDDGTTFECRTNNGMIDRGSLVLEVNSKLIICFHEAC